MVVAVLSIAVLLGSGTVFGVLFAVALSVVPALAAMSPGRYVDTHRLLGRNWDPTMPIIVLGSVILDVVLASLVHHSPSWAFFLVAAVLLAGVAAVSHFCNVPINRQLRAADPDRIPAAWHDPRPIWRRWHLVRTVLSLLALAANATAVTVG